MLDCESSWNCNSCKNAVTYNAALSTEVATEIDERTVGCSDCASTGFLEYSSTTSKRECTDIPGIPEENTPCDLGMLYDSVYACTTTCSSVLDGCALCSSNYVCLLCTDPMHTITTTTDEWGTTRSVCETEVN